MCRDGILWLKEIECVQYVLATQEDCITSGAQNTTELACFTGVANVFAVWLWSVVWSAPSPRLVPDLIVCYLIQYKTVIDHMWGAESPSVTVGYVDCVCCLTVIKCHVWGATSPWLACCCVCAVQSPWLACSCVCSVLLTVISVGCTKSLTCLFLCVQCTESPTVISVTCGVHWDPDLPVLVCVLTLWSVCASYVGA